MTTKLDLDARIENIEAASARLHKQDYLGLLWLADYVADVDVAIDELRTENERLRAALRMERVDSHVFDEVARERNELWVENKRLQAALEEIADVAHPPDMRAVNIARVALGR